MVKVPLHSEQHHKKGARYSKDIGKYANTVVEGDC